MIVKYVMNQHHLICLYSVKVLEVLRPFVSLLPEVSKPERKVRQLIMSVVQCRAIIVYFS